MQMRQWVRLPTDWILSEGLYKFTWGHTGKGAANLVALMALIAIAHRAEDSSGIAKVTYDDLCNSINVSRATMSKGLRVLEKYEIVSRIPEVRSAYKLTDYPLDPRFGGWAKLPAKPMYSSGRITGFEDFHCRNMTELDAMKLYLLFVAHRSRETNLAHISYGKICSYSGVARFRIKAAISLLAAQSLVHVERMPSTANEQGVANAYRIVGLESRKHMGTTGRTLDTASVQGEP